MDIMVACLSPSTLDISPAIKLQPNSNPSFTSEHAFFLLQKCNTFKQMKQVHARIIRHHLGEQQLIVGKILRLCSSFSKVDYATVMFQQIENPSTFTWNLLMRAYIMNNCSRQAILLYNSMICRGVGVDKFTFPFVMKACLDCSCVEKAREVYGFAVKTGFHGDVYLDNVLMDLCFKCGVADDGLKVFDKMSVRTVVSWTTVVAGLADSGQMDMALELFDRMPRRNVVSWTAMINAYAKSDKPEKAFELFEEMQYNEVKPNEYTLVGLLVACAELGSLELGKWVHDFAIKNGFEIGVYIGTALIDMYSKCGELDHAKKVFDGMESRSLATWNAIITSLGVHGRGEEALARFEEMERIGVKPDGITFVGILCACLNKRDIENGHKYFYYMTDRYGIQPSPDHHVCLLGLYSNPTTL